MRDESRSSAGGRGTLVAALLRAGVPASRAEHVLAAVTQGTCDALWLTLKDGRRSDADFDPITSLLEQIDVTRISTELGVHEDIVATALVTLLPRLLRKVRDTRNQPLDRAEDDGICRERLAVRVLVRLLERELGYRPNGSARGGRSAPRRDCGSVLVSLPEYREARIARRLRAPITD